MKKVLTLVLSGILLAGAIIIAKPVETEAAYSCTYDIINDANAKIVAAQNNLSLAQAEEARCRAAFEAVKSQGPSSLAYVQAAAAVENAVNQKNYAAGQVQNAQAYLANIKGREAEEDALLNSIDALGVLNNVQAAQAAAKGAQEIANAALVQVKNTQTAIAGYQQQLDICPSVQAQIDALNVQLVAQTADYNNKQAIANQKLATFQTLVAAGGYQGYTPKYIDAYHKREKEINTYHCQNYDWYTGTCSSSEDCGCGTSLGGSSCCN